MKRCGIQGLKIIVEIIGSLFPLSIFIFCIARIAPGDPLRSYYGESVERMSEQEKQNARKNLGLDKPLFTQYYIWLNHLAHGELGISFQYKQPVKMVISNVIGNTILLGVTAYVLIFLLAFLLGTLCIQYEQSFFDRWTCRIGTVFTCIPSFWIALLLILLFSVNLGILPSGGAYSIGQEKTIKDIAKHLVLPVTVLTVEHVWYYAYLLRNRLLEETRKDYVIFALSKGIPKWYVVWKHCLKSVLPFYVNLMALSIPHILGGTYIVEKVFSYPGLGTLCFESAKYHDYDLLMTLSLMTAGVVMFANQLAKILCEWLDPRMKEQWMGGESDEAK